MHSHENIGSTQWLFRFCIEHNKGSGIQGVSLARKIFGSDYFKKNIKEKNKHRHSTLWNHRKAIRVSNSSSLRRTVQGEDMRSEVQEWHKFGPWNPMESWKKTVENLKYFWSYKTERLTASGLKDPNSFLVAFQRVWSLSLCFRLPLSSPRHFIPEWLGPFKKRCQLQWFVIN